MDLVDLYEGRRRWSDYIRNQRGLESVEATTERHAAGSPQIESRCFVVPLAPAGYAIAIRSGLGAVGPELINIDGAKQNLEVGLERLGGGLDRLNADFNLILGDAIWQLELRQESLDGILHEIRLAEFEREARAYRKRGERAYLNGWYEEALSDFLEAEKRNYPDFAVHRSIANIYLYHLIDLGRALEYFCKAARYARPSDSRQAAEAHYFAGIVCAIRHEWQEAQRQFDEAAKLNPLLSEANYQHACLAALLGDARAATSNLRASIEGDPRYHERAKNDRAFDRLRPVITKLLERLMQPVRDKLREARRELKPLPGYVIAQSEEKRLSERLREIETRLTEAKTYKSGIEFLEILSRFREELRDLSDLFRKQYQIDLNDYVRSVAFSPDGRSLASGFLNGGIKIFDVYTGLRVLSLDGHNASVNSVAFSPNSRQLASGSRDKTIRIWDVETGAEIRALHGHDSEVRGVVFSPDGRWLVSGGHDRTVRMWRAETGRLVQVLGQHRHFVTSVAFSPNGRWIATASLDKTIKLWDVTTWQVVRTLRGHAKGIESLAFSPDGRLIASGGDDRVIKVWDTNGRELHTLSGLANDVTSLSFSPDGKLLAAGSLGKMIKVWRVAAGELIKTVRFTEISYNSVAFSPEGQWLALGSRDIQLWLKAVLTEEDFAAVKAGEVYARTPGSIQGPNSRPFRAP